MSTANQNWIKMLRGTVKNNPMASSSILGFILVGLEKLVDINFECPCTDARWNRLFSSAFFVIPTIMALLIMIMLELPSWKKPYCFHIISIILPPMVWLIQVFIDGEYFDCASTDRKGKYIQIENDPTHRWCKPLNNTEDEIQLLLRAKFNFVISQSIGIGILILVVLILLFCIISRACDKTNPRAQDGDSETNENLRLRCSGHVISVNVGNDEESTGL